MARKSKIVKDLRRRELVARHAARRTQLKAVIASLEHDDRAKSAARRELAQMPRDASPVRVRNRDVIDGRPRGHVRRTGTSRIRFRQLAHAGQLPGIVKASW